MRMQLFLQCSKKNYYPRPSKLEMHIYTCKQKNNLTLSKMNYCLYKNNRRKYFIYLFEFCSELFTCIKCTKIYNTLAKKSTRQKNHKKRTL
jgi:hypothetical protein